MSDKPLSGQPRGYTLQPGGYIHPTVSSGSVEIDPSAPGTPIRWAFGIEAGLNFLGGTWAVFFPKHFLNMLVTSPSEINATSVTLTKIFGSIVYALATPLLIGLPNTRSGIESRAPTYYLLGAGEVGMIAVALYQALVHGDASGFSQKALFGMIFNMAPALVWRAFVLYRKPQWLGRYRDAGRKNE